MINGVHGGGDGARAPHGGDGLPAGRRGGRRRRQLQAGRGAAEHRDQDPPPAAGLRPLRQPQVRQARPPLRRLPDAAVAVVGGDARARGGRGVRPVRRCRALRRRPRRLRRVAVRGGAARRRLVRQAAAASVPRRDRLLQAGRRRARDQQGRVPRDDGEHGVLQWRGGRVPDQDHPPLRPRRPDVPAAGHPGAAAAAVQGGGARRGGGRHVRVPRQAVRRHGRRPEPRRGHPHRQLQPLQPAAVAGVHGGEPLPDARGRQVVHPRRHGVQRRAHRRRPRPRPPPGQRRRPRRRGEHREHHAQLVLRQRPLDAAVQLHLPHGRRGGAAVEPRRRRAASQVPAAPHGAHPQGRRRRVLRQRVPARGRAREGGRVAGEGAHGGRRRRAEDEHHHPRPARPPARRAAQVPPVAGAPAGAPPRRAAPLHPGLPARVRALLRARRRARRAGGGAAEPRPRRRRHGGEQVRAAQVREHQQQLSLVRARLRRGQRPRPPRPPRLADRLRLRLQVQQRRLARAPRRAARLLRRRRRRGGAPPRELQPVGGQRGELPAKSIHLMIFCDCCRSVAIHEICMMTIHVPSRTLH